MMSQNQDSFSRAYAVLNDQADNRQNQFKVHFKHLKRAAKRNIQKRRNEEDDSEKSMPSFCMANVATESLRLRREISRLNSKKSSLAQVGRSLSMPRLD